MEADGRRVSCLYVVLQFSLIGLVAWPVNPPRMEIIPVALFAAGLAVFVAALAAMRGDTFTIMPEPRAEGRLITGGVYGFVRHPMYLAVLLCAVGACLAYGNPWKWALTAVLAVVLVLKSKREEALLLARYPGYASYRQRTRAIVPFLF